jgi:hypothetical protein
MASILSAYRVARDLQKLLLRRIICNVNYDDIMISFDMFSISQGEAKMCVQYTTDGWVTTHNVDNLFYAANPTFIVTNLPKASDLRRPKCNL